MARVYRRACPRVHARVQAGDWVEYRLCGPNIAMHHLDLAFALIDGSRQTSDVKVCRCCSVSCEALANLVSSVMKHLIGSVLDWFKHAEARNLERYLAESVNA